MRGVAATFGTIVLISVNALAQSASQTVQVGYAVVTPSFPMTGGMIVFDTITQTRGQNTLQAGVLPSNLIMNALLPVSVSSTSSKNLALAIVNPNNGIATVNMALIRSDGTQLTTTALTISGHQQVSRFVTELFTGSSSSAFASAPRIPAEFAGTLIATSFVPISILGLQFAGPNFSTIPVADLSPINIAFPAISLGVGGLGAVLLPQFVAGGGWTTTITILNTTTNSLTVRVDVFAQDGPPLRVTLNGLTSSSFTNLVIPASGLLTLAP
jgi:hypothetical protein